MSPSSSSHDIVLTSSPEGPITAYNASTGAVLARLTGTRSPRRGLALVQNTYIAASHISSSSTAAVHLYNWWSSTALHRLPLPEPVAPLAPSPDGSCIFAGGLSGNIHSLSVPSGDLIASFLAHPGSPVSCLEISPDWSLLVSGGDDGRIAVFPVFQFLQNSSQSQNDKSMTMSFTAHDGPVTAIVLCMGISQPTVVSCSTDSTCKLWNLLEGKNLMTVAFPCPISGVALDPSETDLYAAGSDGSVYHGVLKYESRKNRSGQLITALPGKHRAAIVSIALVNGGKRLVSAAEDGSVHVRKVETGEIVITMGDSNLESISEMVVAKRGIVDDGGRRRHGYGGSESFDFWGCGGSSSPSGLPGKELCALGIKEAGELEKVMSSVMEDRGKAINMLESAIEVYGSLLKLILKEANRGTNNNSNNI
ncbi:unnamed protein product [Linum trigynum]|uniref:Uncharacterized protein n=1 Tax=Linum trigynum TaxID=586398 RepID=A0AAV2DVR3_9ROSI